jgi:hypothetical protein
VKFGDNTGRHVPVSTTRQPTMVRPAEVCAEIEKITCSAGIYYGIYYDNG